MHDIRPIPATPLTLTPGIDRTDPVAIATLLGSTDIEEAVLLTVHDDGTARAEPLHRRDPITAMCGRHATPDTTMVGLAAPASVLRRGEDTPARSAGVVHLVTIDGISVTTVREESGAIITFGPDTAPQSGRVPDACRRVLGLPTPPPDSSLTPFVLGAWLEVLRPSVDEGDLDWPALVARHPAAAALGDRATPVDVAAATRELGEAMDWDRFRLVIARVGGFPLGPLAVPVARWTDAGMFSRWAMEQLPAVRDALDRLTGAVTPGALDRLWATAHLCGAVDDGDEAAD